MAINRREEIPKEFEEFAPVFFIMNILSHKWTLPIFLYLQEPMQFNQLQKKLGVSHHILSKALKDLEFLKMLKRNVITETNPPTVEYSLTKYGKKLLQECLDLMRWAEFESLFKESDLPPSRRKKESGC